MDMSEEMCFEIMERLKFYEDFLRTIVDAIVEVKDSIGWRVCYQNIRVVGNIGKVAILAVSYAIFKKHRYAIEFQAVNLDAGVA